MKRKDNIHQSALLILQKRLDGNKTEKDEKKIEEVNVNSNRKPSKKGEQNHGIVKGRTEKTNASLSKIKEIIELNSGCIDEEGAIILLLSKGNRYISLFNEHNKKKIALNTEEEAKEKPSEISNNRQYLEESRTLFQYAFIQSQRLFWPSHNLVLHSTLRLMYLQSEYFDQNAEALAMGEYIYEQANDYVFNFCTYNSLPSVNDNEMNLLNTMRKQIVLLTKKIHGAVEEKLDQVDEYRESLRMNDRKCKNGDTLFLSLCYSPSNTNVHHDLTKAKIKKDISKLKSSTRRYQFNPISMEVLPKHIIHHVKQLFDTYTTSSCAIGKMKTGGYIDLNNESIPVDTFLLNGPYMQWNGFRTFCHDFLICPLISSKSEGKDTDINPLKERMKSWGINNSLLHYFDDEVNSPSCTNDHHFSHSAHSVQSPKSILSNNTTRTNTTSVVGSKVMTVSNLYRSMRNRGRGIFPAENFLLDHLKLVALFTISSTIPQVYSVITKDVIETNNSTKEKERAKILHSAKWISCEKKAWEKAELAMVDLSLNQKEPLPNQGINFFKFLDCLGRIAYSVFSDEDDNSTYDQIYPEGIDKLNALLISHMGLTDNKYWQNIQRNHKVRMGIPEISSLPLPDSDIEEEEEEK